MALPFLPDQSSDWRTNRADWCSLDWASLLLHTPVTTVECPINQEAVMEIAIAFGGLVGVFVLGGALILFWPYDRP